MPPSFHSFKVDQRTCQCCSFCSSLLCFSAGTWSAAGTTNSRLLCRIVDHSKTIGQKGRGLGGGEVGEFSYDSWTSFFSVCLITCPFKELPVVGRRERATHLHKAEVFAVLLTERGWRVGGRQRDVKRDARSVIMSSLPEKCRCFSKWCRYRHQFCCVVSALTLLSHNPSVTYRNCRH